MKLMIWAAAIPMSAALLCTHAASAATGNSTNAHPAPVAPTGGWTGVVDTHASGAEAWLQQTDFASASGSLPATTVASSWSSPLGPVEFGSMHAQGPGSDTPSTWAGSESATTTDIAAGDPQTGAGLAHHMALAHGEDAWNGVLAVPEPSGLLMMLAGFGAIVVVIRRRRQ